MPAGNIFSAFGSGINEWLPFEIVNRTVAAGAAAMGHGTYHENMRKLEAQDEANRKAHPWAYGAGAVGGAIGGGGALARGVGATGNVISRLGAPVVGDAVTALTTLKRGQLLKNVGKLAAGGAAYGGTDETLRGGSPGQVAEAAGVGMVAAPLTAGALKMAGYLGRPLVDLVANKNYGQILRRITTASMDDLQKARTDYKAKTGAEPTLFELLPKGDRDKIGTMVIRNSPNLQDQAATAIRSRAANVEPEMRASVEGATKGKISSIQDALAADLAKSRGETVPAPEDISAAQGATGSTAGAAKLREAEARNIMAPHDSKVAYPSVDDMLPQTPQVGPKGTIEFTDADPEVSALIKRASGLLRVGDNGITIGNITDIQRGLKKMVDRNDVNSDAAQRALNHIDDLLQQDHPEAAAAIQQMRDAYAGRSRMIEGMEEGGRTRTANQYPVNDAGDLNTYRNIYETPEGEAGRTAGQTNQLLENFGGTPDQAIATTGKLAEDTATRRAIEQNISPKVAAQLSDAAGAQAEGLRRLAELRGKTKGDVADSDLRHLGDALLAFNPASFAMTRMAALSRLMQLTTLGEKKASYLVDKLFSQDPSKINEGLKLFDRMGGKGRQFLGDLANSVVVTGAHAGAYGVTPMDQGQPDAAPPAETTPDISKMSDEDLQKIANQPQAEASPYAGQTDNYSPEFQQLFHKVLGQESGHSQTDKQGNPLQSKAGAVGIAQVMPETAPKAAELASLPWDEHAYYTDPEYNKALGAAYLNDLLRQFNGNPALAVAAYNAGPGNVQKAIARGQGDWQSHLPDETKGYLQAIFQ